MTVQKKIDQAGPIRYYLKTQTMGMWLISYFARSLNRAVNTAAAHCTTQLLVVHVSSGPWENICCHFLLTNNSAMPGSVIDLSEDELPAPIGKRKAMDKSSARNLFATTATSAPSERVFSRARLLMAPPRSRPGDETVEYLTVLRANARFLDNPVIGRFSQPS